MFKLLFLKILYHLSDERVIQEAQVNMADKYFLNLEPDDQLMHPSSLTKFRKLRLNQEAILEELLLEMVSQAIEKGLIKSKTLILDATHIRSKYTTQTPLEILRQVSKNIRKQLSRYVPQVKEDIPKKLHSTASLEEEVAYTKALITFTNDDLYQHVNLQKATETALQVLEDEAYPRIFSLPDPEVKLGHKSSKESFTGYPSHLAITDERLMTVIEVATGEVSDGK